MLRGVRVDGKQEISLDEFVKWLEKFDANRDGQIAVEELQAAIQANRGWFSKWKAKRGVKLADENSNGFIDKNEIRNLVVFAEKHLGVVIV
ncbi:hypothetical protein Pfo_016900 [Paulownia fortunei]|nr:hypothetical protein Pfo_016900 [Paulownia fortunei]